MSGDWAFGKHTAQKADDDLITANDSVVWLSELDIPEVAEEIIKTNTKDVFSRKMEKLSGVPKKTKARGDRLQKRLEGDGAASKYQDPIAITGYQLFDVVMPPYDLDALASLYDENSMLRATVDARVTNTVGLGTKWVPTTKAQKQIEKASDSEEKSKRLRNTHQKVMDSLDETFEKFNQDATFIETMMKVWTDVLTLGNGYVEIGRTLSGKIGYVGHVPGQMIRIRRKRDGFVQSSGTEHVFFRNFGDRNTADPINSGTNPNELIHFKVYSPTNSFYGVPPSVTVISAIIGDKFAKEFNIDYFENKAIPRYAIVLKGVKLSEKSKKELINYFRNEVKGNNHGTLVIPLPATIGNGPEADVKFEKLEADVQDASFIEYRKMNREEIAVAYRVPPTKVAIFENANLAVSRDADKTFKAQVVGPDQESVESRMNKIVAEFTDLFKMEFEQIDIIDEDLRSRIHDRYLRTQVLVPNDVREAVGKPPIPGGDTPLPYPNANLKFTADVLSIDERRDQEGFGPAPGGEGNLIPAIEAMKNQEKLTQLRGGQVGNNNASGGSPPKSGQDSGKNRSSADATGTNAERGQVQDTRGTRERS